jgi:hypothetical protein
MARTVPREGLADAVVIPCVELIGAALIVEVTITVSAFFTVSE